MDPASPITDPPSSANSFAYEEFWQNFDPDDRVKPQPDVDGDDDAYARYWRSVDSDCP